MIDIETVRAEAQRQAEPDEPLPFYAVALAMGATPAQAERIDETLMVRVMRARGAI